jgi:hypothetical protein
MRVRESVADPVIGVNEAQAVGLDLASEVRDMCPQRLPGVHVRHAPNLP